MLTAALHPKNDGNYHEEVIHYNWPVENRDASLNDDFDWEILNDNGANDSFKRHWFKQNYIRQIPQNVSIVTYH